MALCSQQDFPIFAKIKSIAYHYLFSLSMNKRVVIPAKAGIHTCNKCNGLPRRLRLLNIPLHWRGGRRSLTGWLTKSAMDCFTSFAMTVWGTSVVTERRRLLSIMVALGSIVPIHKAATLYGAEKQNLQAALLPEQAGQMIEELVFALEPEEGAATEKGELTDNVAPTSSLFASIPNIKPVYGTLSSLFGMRMHPIYNMPLFHSGIDIAAPIGTKVHATGDGIVAFVGNSKGYGQKITINHGYGYKTIYAHLSKMVVQQGDNVRRGDTIGLSGNSGTSTGAHLHYEVLRYNQRLDPSAFYFEEHGARKFTAIQSKQSPKDNS
uniref:Metalloendopeptidases-like membarne protein n=1 Tax=Chlorobium chlorochromatii (strain CaD3) TaxID=340177 RepID=Q3AU69_CHLCH